MPTRDSMAPVAGSERQPLPGAKKIGPADPDQRIKVTVYVRQLGPEASIEKLGAQYPQERRYLGVEEFNRTYGADPADLQRVAAFARAHGLAVLETNPARRSVLLSGTVSAMSEAFGTELSQYEHPSGAYRGRTGPLHVPADLQGIVEGVFGLDNRCMARSYVRRAKSTPVAAEDKLKRPAGGFLPPEVAALYNFPRAQQGRGQTLGIFTFNEFEGGYNAPALETYFREVLNTSPPEMVDVVVHGRGNAPSNSRDARNVTDEVMLDVQVAGAMAPGARLAMYFSDFTEQGWVDALSTAVNDTANNPSVLSISYGNPEDDRGSAWTATAIAQVNKTLRAAAAKGITVCCASGDDGSSDDAGGKKAHADFPASSPYALACGGTSIKTVGGAIESETVWNDSDGAGGGGISAIFDPPEWQSGVHLPPSANPGAKQGRGLPDVAGLADPETGFTIINVTGKKLVIIGGTSATAPLWAALIARINEGLGVRVGYLNPLLYARLAGVLRDITQGSNGAYKAGSGWDACTGLGSPDGAALLNALRKGPAA